MEGKHILSVLVKNSAGVLSRVSGLFSRRGYNIDSLTVGRTENKEISRMTITLNGDDDVLEQVKKQVDKLEDVIKVIDINWATLICPNIKLSVLNPSINNLPIEYQIK